MIVIPDPRLVALLLAAALTLATPARAAAARGPAPVARPMTLDHGRVIVEMEFVRPDGGTRVARVWVDTGGENLLMGRDLARDLGIEHPAWPDSGAFTTVAATSPTPAVRFGAIALDTAGLVTRVRDGAVVLPGVPAEAGLPARTLRRLCAVFDYPARRLTLAAPGTLAPRGAALPCRVNPVTGLPMIVAALDGDAVPLGLDTGSAGTWLSDSLTQAWRLRHPDSPHAIGAAGSANFFGFPFEPAGTLLSLPRIGIGSAGAGDVAALALDPGFFRWYSRKSAAPLYGFLGANVLSRYRLTVDFANGMTWWQGGGASRPRDLDIVGLTLRPEGDSGYTVAGVVTRNGVPVVAGVRAGDRLLQVDSLGVAGATMGTVVGALRGRPGASHRLVLERDGQRLTLPVTVARLP
jgi:hypothetical protein